MRVWFLVLALLFGSGLAHAFDDDALPGLADLYRQQLLALPATPLPADALTRADAALKAKQWSQAVPLFEALVRAHPEQGGLWLKLGRARGNAEPSDANARAAAWQALQLATTAKDKAAALFVIGRLFEVNEMFKPALAAYDEGLALFGDASITRRAEALREQLMLRPTGAEASVEGDQPRLCVSFSEPLSRERSLHWADFLAIEPALPQAVVNARGEQICIEGVAWGTTYQVTVRAGVPGVSVERRSRASETFTVAVGDRAPKLEFRGNTWVLPKKGGGHIALLSVNLPAAKLQLLRFNDRNLVEQLRGKHLDETYYAYETRRMARDNAELVWEGTVDLAGERNQQATTLLPIDTVLKTPQPGIYLLTAAPLQPLDGDEDYQELATQWLLISDLGLSAMRGEDGLHLFVRSLDSAQPTPGVTLTLYSRSNAELASVSTDAEGQALFAPGLLRGEGARAPQVVMASTSTGDFSFLDLGEPAFDLSDRGVEGRPAPGALDAWLYSDRGVYRPGEAVELSALLRDTAAKAVEELPLTLIINRPDGSEAERRVLQPAAAGSYHTRIELAPNARSGQWRVALHADPKAEPIGRYSFRVEDFVPQRLHIELSAAQPVLHPGEPLDVELSGRFLYGAPAATLPAEFDATLEADPEPYPQWKDYQFGLVQDSFEPTGVSADSAAQTSDAEGHAQARYLIAAAPDTTRPLRLSVRAGLEEPGGSIVRRVLRVPLRSADLALGIHPQFASGELGDGQHAGFDVIALDGAGKRRAAAGLRYELFRESYDYVWYRTDSGRLDWKQIVRDGAPLRSGTLDVAADSVATLGFDRLDGGPYRLEVFDAAGAVASSVRFSVGWVAQPGSGERPDQAQVLLDREQYAAGDTAKIRVRAPFAGELLLSVASHKVWATHHAHVPADGLELSLPVKAEWGPGVYVTATVFRPGRSAAQAGPGRAIGLAWLALDPAPRRLDVKLDAPAEWRPRQTVQLPLTVAGAAAGDAVYLTLTAVDEGILQLTDFHSPDPLDHYLGKRRLGVDMLDLYGRLIAPAEGVPGELRSGGDADGGLLDAPPLKRRASVVLFSGQVTLGADGKASVPMTLPDFAGQLRLMAVAWSRERLGMAEAKVAVRDPLVADAYPPRFLAPGDLAQVRVQVDDVGAAPGAWRLQASADGALALEGETQFTLDLGPGRDKQLRQRLQLRGQGVGDGSLRLTLDGPDGTHIVHDWPLTVRAAVAVERHVTLQPLAAGASLHLDAAPLADFLPGSTRLRVLASPQAPLDREALLAELGDYAYGCVEQTTSRLLPLIGDDSRRAQAEPLLRRLLAQQGSDGGFGRWSALDDIRPWLSAYATEALVRAHEAGLPVPEAALKRALDTLHGQLEGADPDATMLAARAYAAWVLARADVARPGEIRYLIDAWGDRLPTRLASAQLAAAAARYGDAARAKRLFAQAQAKALPRTSGLDDYGSELRDDAAVLTLALEAHAAGDDAALRAVDLATRVERQHWLSTQEQSWLATLAARLPAGSGTPQLTLDGKPLAAQQDRVVFNADLAALAHGQTLANAGSSTSWLRLSASGLPAGEPAPYAEGIALVRRYFDLDGKALDPAHLKAGQTLVVTLDGEVRTDGAVQLLVADLLPAGFELENAALGPSRSAGELPWLSQLSETEHVELRDDRYVAALDLGERRSFSLAYLVRAVTPGDYRLPPPVAEDMVRPTLRARGEAGRVVIE